MERKNTYHVFSEIERLQLLHLNECFRHTPQLIPLHQEALELAQVTDGVGQGGDPVAAQGELLQLL